VSKKGHRWKEWVEDERVLKVLGDAAVVLKCAWERDQKNRKKFPVDTWANFYDLSDALDLRTRKQSGKRIRLVRERPAPQRLSELLDEALIKTVYEEHNAKSYEHGLNEARQDYGKGKKAWKKVHNAIAIAYTIMYEGLEYAPRPRNDFLHSNLLALANLAGLGDLNNAGLAEFFDDTCPCRKKHTSEAIRKIRERAAKK
jgi:hypothetical protein